MVNLVLFGILTAVFIFSPTKQSSFIKSTASLNKDLLVDEENTRISSSILPSRQGNFELPPFSTVSDPDPRIKSKHIESIDEFNQIGELPNVSPTPDLSIDFPLLEDNFTFDVEAPLLTIMSFCPYTQSCENDTNHSMFTNECCIPCDCSDRCYTAGNCCIDKTNGSQQHGLDPSFYSAEENCVNTLITNGSSNINKISSYLLFQSCNKTVDYQTKQKCMYPDMLQLDEMRPVFSRKSQLHYRNVFCAECNNDSSDVEFWQTYLICNRSFSDFPTLFGGNLTISELLLPNCEVGWEPPSNIKNADLCLYEQNIVSDCNTPILDSLCKNFYAPVKSGSVIYKNLFCMECAVPSNFTGLYQECIDQIFGDDLDRHFTLILSLSKNQPSVSMSDFSEVNRCLFPKKYNDYLGSCIYHTCAISEIGTAGVCIPAFSKILGIHLEYRLKVLYQKDSQDFWIYYPVVMFDNNIKKVLGFSSIEAFNICFADILNITISSELIEIKIVYFRYVVTVNVEQAYNDYEKNIATYNEMVKTNNDTFRLQIDKSDIEPVYEDSATLIQFSKSNLTHSCGNNMAVSKLQFCDTITFQKKEFKILSNGVVSINDLMFAPGEFILRKTLNGTLKYVQVCLDDYISTYNRKYRLTSVAGLGGKPEIGNLYLVCSVIFLSQHCKDKLFSIVR